MISDHSDPLAIIGGEEAGGQNIYVRELSDQLIKRGYEVHIFTRLSDQELPKEQTSKHGFKVIRIKCGPTGFIPKEQIINHSDEFIDGIKNYIKKHHYGYDLIHSHYWISGIIGLKLRSFFKIPLFHTFHSLGKIKHEAIGIENEQAASREKYEEQIINDADHIIATCPEERKQLLSLYKASADKITIIPVGVNTNRFYRRKKNEARKKINLNPHDKIILFVGRLAPQKGLSFLLNVFAVLLKDLAENKKEKTKLLIVGGSSKRNRTQKKEEEQLKTIQKLIENLDLQNHVKLAGRVPNNDLPWYYSAADVCVVPSRYEPFGIVPLEAMACGVPVIASRVGGLQYTVQNLKTGFLARTNDMIDFAYKIRLIIMNSNLKNEFGKNGIERIAQEFSWETIGNKILKFYLSFLHTNE
jgi:glycosyltransferase involved in cell wall biosynthesis